LLHYLTSKLNIEYAEKSQNRNLKRLDKFSVVSRVRRHHEKSNVVPEHQQIKHVQDDGVAVGLADIAKSKQDTVDSNRSGLQ